MQGRAKPRSWTNWPKPMPHLVPSKTFWVSACLALQRCLQSTLQIIQTKKKVIWGRQKSNSYWCMEKDLAMKLVATAGPLCTRTSSCLQVATTAGQLSFAMVKPVSLAHAAKSPTLNLLVKAIRSPTLQHLQLLNVNLKTWSFNTSG